MKLTKRQREFIEQMRKQSTDTKFNKLLDRILKNGRYHPSDRLDIYQIIGWYKFFWIDKNDNSDGYGGDDARDFMLENGFGFNEQTKKFYEIIHV